jgi:hypothetical protein
MSKRLYQRQIPLIILSVFAGVLIVQYFAPPRTPLDAAKNELISVNNTVMLMTQLFGVVTLLLWRGRSLYRRTGTLTQRISNVVFWATYIAFLILGVAADPVKLHAGATYRTVYLATVATLTTTATGFKFVHHTFWTFRLFSSVASLESAVLFLTWLLTYLRELPFFVYLFPPFALIGDWIEMFPFAAASRALLLSTAVGACIIAARALVGREPGLIDMEMV